MRSDDPFWTEVGNPGWLLREQVKWLGQRRPMLERYDDYYSGLHDLQLTSEKFAEAFGPQVAPIADNITAMVVDAAEERLNVEGFRIEADDAEAQSGVHADPVAWEIWQRNGLDAESHHAHVEALICGESFAEVAIDDDGEPVIDIHHANDTMVVRDPMRRRQRRAAIRVWKDLDGTDYARVYSQTRVWDFVNLRGWQLVDEDAVDGVPHGFDEVPIVPLINRSRLRGAVSPHPSVLTTRPRNHVARTIPSPRHRNRRQDQWVGGGDSEIRQVIPVQDALNKVLADAIIVSEFAAYPQRWATGLQDVGRDQQVAAAVNRMLTTKSDGARFGSFQQADLGGHVRLIEMLVQHVSSQSRTPPHYFFLGGHFPSGESIRSAEAGLVSKCRLKTRFLGEGWEETLRLALSVKDRRVPTMAMETKWEDLETRTESQHIDALVKKRELRIPYRQLQEDAGYTDQQIRRFEQMERAEQQSIQELLGQFDQADEEAEANGEVEGAQLADMLMGDGEQ